MFDKWLKLPAHLYLRLTALLIITVGLGFNNVLMSIGTIWIFSNWLLEGEFQNKLHRFKSDKVLWFISFIFFYSILSVAWSDDVGYWFHDIRVKLPFFVIPFVMGTSEPLQKRFFYFLMIVLVGMMLFTTLLNYLTFDHQGDLDIRYMSRFISHVRYSTLVVIAIFVCIYLILKNVGPRLIWAACIPWFIFYTYKSEVLNGYLLFGILSVLTILYIIRYMERRLLKWVSSISLLIVLIAASLLIVDAFNTYSGLEEVDVKTLPRETPNGNKYYHNTDIRQFQDGKFIWINVCQKELEQEWNERSSIPYDSLDQMGQPMFGTLLRYLTSKDLTKDSLGVWTLTEEEIAKIESGRTSEHKVSGLKAKIHSFLIQYDIYRDGGDPNGHSILQRMEHLRIARCVLAQHWLLGVGTGDVRTAYESCYISTESQLLTENQHRAHNQFLSVWISHGLVGLLAMIFVVLVPFIRKEGRDYFRVVIGVTILVSFLFQDMIETQAGVTIFGYLYALALYRDMDKRKKSIL